MKNLILAVLGVLAFVAAGFYNGVSFAEEQAIAKPFGYTIERGDNLYRLAKRFKTTKNEILSINKGSACIRNENLILKGCTLNINDLFPEKEMAKLFNAYEKNFVGPLWQENVQLKKAGSTKTILLVGVGGVAALLFMGLLIMMVRWASYRDSMKEIIQKHLDLATEHRELYEAESAQLSTKLALKTEQVAALTQAKQEAEKLRESLIATQDEIKRLKTEKEELLSSHVKLMLDSGAALSKLAAFESLRKGAVCVFTSRDQGLIPDGFVIEETHLNEKGALDVMKIKCVKCGTLDVKYSGANMNSHYWKCIESLKETVDRT